MLGIWRSHAEYQSFLINSVLPLFINDKENVEFYSQALSKLYFLDFDVLKPPCFSTTVKPSNQQPEIFRSFSLMSDLHYISISKWVAFLKANAILCYAIGVARGNVPGVGSHYDFINRLWVENPEVEQNRQDSLHPFKSKPRKKLGKNQKQPPRHPGIVKKLVDLALQGKSFENRPEMLFKQIFGKVAVEPSAKAGLLGDNNLTISGDGTCINTGGSAFGIKTCDCISKGIYNCNCHRRFSDPDARHGWDRIKWRCPYAKGKIKSCSCKEKCSPSSYGRTIYTKPKWILVFLLLFLAVVRSGRRI